MDDIAFLPSQIQQSLIAELQDEEKQQSLTAESALSQASPTITGTSHDGFAISLLDGSIKAVPQMLFDCLSFTHIVHLSISRMPCNVPFMLLRQCVCHGV